ncbi:hypothetical protein ACUOCP_34085, partial [Escherichia sp. R-CC3]
EDTCPQRRFLHNRVSNDEIYALVDDLIAAHGDWLPGWLHR